MMRSDGLCPTSGCSLTSAEASPTAALRTAGDGVPLNTAVASEGIAIVERAHRALNSGDVDALIDLCSEDFRLDMSDRVFNPAVYEGHDGIRRFYAEVQDVWEIYVWEPEQLIDFGADIFALIRTTGRGRESGVEVERETAMVWTVGEGRLNALHFYRDRTEALQHRALDADAES